MSADCLVLRKIDSLCFVYASARSKPTTENAIIRAHTHTNTAAFKQYSTRNNNMLRVHCMQMPHRTHTHTYTYTHRKLNIDQVIATQSLRTSRLWYSLLCNALSITFITLCALRCVRVAKRGGFGLVGAQCGCDVKGVCVCVCARRLNGVNGKKIFLHHSKCDQLRAHAARL